MTSLRIRTRRFPSFLVSLRSYETLEMQIHLDVDRDIEYRAVVATRPLLAASNSSSAHQKAVAHRDHLLFEAWQNHTDQAYVDFVNLDTKGTSPFIPVLFESLQLKTTDQHKTTEVLSIDDDIIFFKPGILSALHLAFADKERVVAAYAMPISTPNGVEVRAHSCFIYLKNVSIPESYFLEESESQLWYGGWDAALLTEHPDFYNLFDYIPTTELYNAENRYRQESGESQLANSSSIRTEYFHHIDSLSIIHDRVNCSIAEGTEYKYELDWILFPSKSDQLFYEGE